MAVRRSHDSPVRARLSRRASTLIALSEAALVAVALAGFGVTQHVVEQQDRRTLASRAAAIAASLASSSESALSSLQVLGRIASSPSPDRLGIFDEAASVHGGQVVAVAVARPSGAAFRVVTGVGRGVSRGVVLDKARSAALRRATATTTFAASLLSGQPRVLLALAVGELVVYQESLLVPSQSSQAQQPNPYADLEIALYTGVDRKTIVLATAALPFAGSEVEQPVLIGADRWLLVVASAQPQIGAFAHAVPWMLLAFGLVTALLVGVALLVAARRRTYAEEAVRERTADLERTKAFQESLLTSGPTIVVRATVPDLEVTYLSPNAERLLGLRLVDGLPARRDPAAYVGAEDLLRGALALQRIADLGSAEEQLEVQVRFEDGRTRWLAVTLVPDTEAATGGPPGVLAYVSDVEDRKQAEQEARAAQRSAEAANRAKSAFLSRMSHELRTPMNAVLGFGQLLERDELTAGQRESVSFVLKAGRHLLTLIDEVLDISRIESGTMTFSSEPVHPDDVLAEALELIQPLADARGIPLVHDPCAPDLFVLADHQRLKQVLLNLLSNAVKYNVDGGSVTLSVSGQPERGTVRISVIDTGPGIPRDRRDELFAPFQRLGAEHGPVEGTGIGLALSRQLVHAMHGELDVESVPGEGSAFWVELPATEPPAHPSTPSPGATPEEAVISTPRQIILQIEDNPSNARLMERILESRPDVELVVAGQGRLGLDLAREHRPSLVLLDLHLPDISGEEVLAQLRRDPGTADIPVVVVSADGTHGQERRLVEAGALRYLTKPFEVRELLDLVDTVLTAP